jgi:hypothetical protein
MRISKMLLAAVVAAGPLVAAGPATTAEAGGGCVTVREARDTLANTRQSRPYIERGFGDTGWTEDRIGNALWRSYQPCEYPGRNDTFVNVIYGKNAAGVWKSIYWHWALYYPSGMRTATGEWNGMSRG